jgi:hypothetical protein
VVVTVVVTLDTNRAEKTKRWRIPDKFINEDFANFLLNINVLSENDVYRDERPIKDAFGSVDEWADHFQLWDLHGIDLDAILKLLSDKGCARIFKKENYIKYHHQNMAYLEAEIRARIKGN